MDRLASCYFCGVAVDAPLEEYPVVPRDLRPSVENQQTVVLCPECRRKLSTIVDSVVAAATDPDQTTLTGTESAGSTAESADSEDVERTTEAVESTEDRPSNASLIEGFGHDEPSLIEVEGSPAEESTAADDVATEGREHSDASAPEGPETDGDAGATGDADADSDADAETADGAGEEPGEQDFSTSSYNRVVRLLQNREFPIDVEEITTIAGSAYEIERRETDAVLDALVDRGVIEREGDQLFRPNE